MNRPDPIILAIETSGDNCEVAIGFDSAILASAESDIPRAHAENLAPMMEKMLASVDLDASSIDAVGVSAGPGSYTGLRIGVSTAKGLAYATGAKLIGVGTLQSVALNHAITNPNSDKIVVSRLARKESHYVQVFRRDGDSVVPQSEVKVMSWRDVGSALVELGAGALCTDVATEIGPSEISGPIDLTSRPTATAILKLASMRWKSNSFDDLGTFEPAYVQTYVARKSSRTAFGKLSF